MKVQLQLVIATFEIGKNSAVTLLKEFTDVGYPYTVLGMPVPIIAAVIKYKGE